MNLGDNIPLLHEGRFWSWIRIRAALELVRAKRAQEIWSAPSEKHPKGEFLGIEYGHFGFICTGHFKDDPSYLPPAELPGIIFRPPISARGRKYLMALPKPWE
jgi:hypothetical protein